MALNESKDWDLPALPEMHNTVRRAVVGDLEVSVTAYQLCMLIQLWKSVMVGVCHDSSVVKVIRKAQLSRY